MNNDYLALVGRGTAGFKDLFAPGSPLLAEEAGAFVMLSFTASTPRLRWRIWIPPGTRSLQASIYTYASPPESKVLMRMYEPPVGGLDSVTPENSAAVDSTNVLAALLSGAEVPCHAPSEAGTVKLSAGKMDSSVVTTTGGWLYVNALQLPGQQIFKIESYISVDKAAYLNWYASATWDDQNNPVAAPAEPYEQRLLQCAIDTGLVDGLRKLSGGLDDDALIAAAQETGTWPALMKFAQCCPRS